jgi:hypothetical protein
MIKWRFSRTLPLVVSVLVSLVVSASAQTKGSIPTIETITSRMAQATADNQTRFRPYMVKRDYKMFGKHREQAKSEVTVNVSFIPPNMKSYIIQHTVGSGLGETIVRPHVGR